MPMSHIQNWIEILTTALFSETAKPDIFDETIYAHTYDVEIFYSFNSELQLKNIEYIN